MACAMLSILYMWLEELKSALQSHAIDLEGPLHCGDTACIYRGRWEGQAVAVKVVQSGDLTVEQVERECRVMLALQTLAVVKVYMCFWVKDNRGKDYFVLVLELCHRDLVTEIKERASAEQYWPESEVWTMLHTLVDVLAYMQEQGTAHRDLKPENIFLSESRLKLGDFGNAKTLTSACLQSTLVGTPLYMSPRLREGLVRGLDQVQHCVYKSDMYSLGVTFVYICMLRAPSTELLRRVQSMEHYSQALVSVLAWMTMEDEQQRCDFTQLRTYLKRQEESDTVQCLNCEISFERTELKSPIQLLCNPSDHLFCSLSCYSTFQSSQDICPRCHTPLQPIDLSFIDTLERQAYNVAYWVTKRV